MISEMQFALYEHHLTSARFLLRAYIKPDYSSKNDIHIFMTAIIK